MAGHQQEAADFAGVTMPTLSFKDRPTGQLLVGIRGRFGQNCRVTRNPILHGVWLEEVVLWPHMPVIPDEVSLRVIESHARSIGIAVRPS